MKLVSDARHWYRWHSTYVFALLAIFPTVWLASPDLQALLSAHVVSAIAPFVGVIGFVVRLRDQGLQIAPPKPTVPETKDGR